MTANKKQVKITSIHENDTNPRFIHKKQFEKLVKSIKSFPEMLEKRPIIIDENNIILGGNMRLKACKEAGLKKVWVDQVTDWTDKQKKEFIIKDNVGFGEWDWDILSNDYNYEELAEWGLEVDFGNDEDENEEVFEDEQKFFISIEFETESQCAEWYDKLQKENLNIKIVQ